MNEGLTFSKSQLLNSLRWPIYVINSFDNAKLPCYTPPPTQHHSFLRNLPPFFLVMRQSVYKKIYIEALWKNLFHLHSNFKISWRGSDGKRSLETNNTEQKVYGWPQTIIRNFRNLLFLFYNLHVIFCYNYFLDFGIKKEGKWRKLIGYKNL